MHEALAIPRGVILDRAPVLERAFATLPDWMLRVLTDSLDRRHDQLIADSLHDRDGNGCAIGILLEDLYPDHYSSLSWRQRRRFINSATIHRERPKLARRYPGMAHIEHVFDTTVELVQAEDPQRCKAEICAAAGLWIAAQALIECESRRREGRQLFGRPPWRLPADTPAPARVPPWGLPDDGPAPRAVPPWGPPEDQPARRTVPPWGLPEDQPAPPAVPPWGASRSGRHPGARARVADGPRLTCGA